MTDLGNFIRDERKKKGWNQAEFANRLGVGQQTVSGWERGSSRPRGGDIENLAEVLEVDRNRFIANTTRTHRTKTTGLINLPLSELTPEELEQFIADLAHTLYPDANVSQFGERGHKQDGIDIEVVENGKMVATFQCKRHRQFGPAKVKDAVEAVTVDSPCNYIVITRPASPDARKEIAKHTEWILWDPADVSRALRYDILPDRAMRLVDTYFRGLREAFLGIPEPGPWLIESEYLSQTTPGGIFTHNLEMVGREDVLQNISDFIDKSDDWIAAISGRGGLGKTRLLHEVVSSMADSKTEIRVLNTNKEVKPEHFELLPADLPLLVIIDDAHDRSDVAELIAGIKRRSPQAKVLLSLRPYGMPQLTYDLRRIQVDSTEIAIWKIDDLKHDEAVRIVEQILGRAYDSNTIRRLAHISTDCPLIAVVGAGLIKQGSLDPIALERDEGIRTRILTAFRDALVADPVDSKTEIRRKVLDAVSILQPVHLQDKDGEFKGALERLTGISMDDILPHINKLEDAGVLLRRGQSLRIVPDLLGDAVLIDACYDSRSGTTKQYIEHARSSVSGKPLQHVFVNASRVDWRIRQHGGQSTSLVDSLWDGLDAEFKTSKVGARYSLLKLIQKVAYFQPDRAIALARYAIEHPVYEVEEMDDILTRAYPPTYQTVLRQIPPVLKNIAYNYDYLAEALDLLWTLAKSDERQTNPNPEHPMRVLMDLAEYGNGKPVMFNETIINTAKKWFDDLDDASPYSPFEVLSKLLATEGSDSYSEGISISFRPYGLRADVVQRPRKQVIDLALSEARSTDLKRAIRAIETIGNGLSYPSGLFGRQVDQKEYDTWTPIFVEEIKQLGELAADKKLDPNLGVAIRRALQWHTDFSQKGTKAAAKAAVAAIPDDDTHHLALVLFDGWGRLLFERIKNYEVAQKRQNEHFEEFAAKLLEGHSVDELVDLLEKLLDTQNRAFGDDKGNAGPFIWALVKKNNEIGTKICDRVKAAPKSALAPTVSVVLSCLAGELPDKIVEITRDLIAGGDADVRARASNSFGWSRGRRSDLLPGELELLRDFAQDENPAVRISAVRAAQVIAEADPLEAVDLLSRVRLTDDQGLTEEYFTTFGTHGQLKWGDLPPDQQDKLWKFLETCESLRDYHLTDFLTHVAIDTPSKVVGLLLRRVEIDEQMSAERDKQEEYARSDYSPIPYDLNRGLNLHSHPQFVGLLRQVIDWIAEKPRSTWQRSHYGSEIFKIITGNAYDERVMGVLNEAVNSGDEDQFYALTAVLHDLPNSVIWDDVNFVVKVLHTAEQYGEDQLKNASSALHSTVISGTRSGTAGQPFAEDIEQRDNAARIANSLPYDSIEQKFYKSLERSAVQSIGWHADRDERHLDNRDWE